MRTHPPISAFVCHCAPTSRNQQFHLRLCSRSTCRSSSINALFAKRRWPFLLAQIALESFCIICRPVSASMTSTIPAHVYEIRPRKDKRGVDLISDVLPFGRLWYGEPNAITNAIGYAKFFSRSHDAVIRVYDETGNVIVIVAGFVGTEYRT